MIIEKNGENLFVTKSFIQVLILQKFIHPKNVNGIFLFFKERLGQDGPREDSIEMLCLPVGCSNPGKGCRGSQSEWWRMVLILT